MNPETIIDFQNRITSMEESIQDIIKIIKGIKIDNNMKLNSNVPIPPGISCKVAYDSNGIILKGDKLSESDIPVLQIEKVDGLRRILDSKINKSDINNLGIRQDIIDNTVGEIIATGTKINYDKNGHVVSSSDITVNDIPELPIDHIADLREELDMIKNIKVISDENNEYNVNPGVYCKISFDSKGRVVSGDKLTLDDIPIELINNMNVIESKIPLLASQRSIDALNKLVVNKLDGNPNIVPGTYTKVTVDTKGLIVSGDHLQIKDLPHIGIDDITGLSNALRNKAEQKDLVTLNDTVSSIVTSLNKIGDVIGIQNTLKTKANDEELKQISSKVNSMQSLIDSLSSKIPNEMILEQLQQIQKEVSSISGRIFVLEKKIGIENAFDVTS